jgi:hypothetical protein
MTDRKGIPTVAMDAYFQVLLVIGIEKDFLKLGADDDLGRKLQEATLLVKKRALKNNYCRNNFSLCVLAGLSGTTTNTYKSKQMQLFDNQPLSNKSDCYKVIYELRYS